MPAPQWAVEEYGSDKWASGDVPFWSNGPFKLDRWEHDVMVEMSPNPGYWNFENIHLKKVYQPIIPAECAVLSYERGEGDQRLDWVNVPASDLPRFQEDPELSQQLHSYVYPGIWMLVPSNGQEPFQNDEVGLKVRRALSHAIDRTRLVELTNGLAIEAYGMVPTGVYGYIDDPEIAAIQAFDPALAKEQLVGTPYEGGQNWPEITMHMRGERGDLQRRPDGERHRGPASGKPGDERQYPGLAGGVLATGAVQERVPARLDPLVVRLPGSEQRLRRHVLQPESLRQAPGVVERGVRRSGESGQGRAGSRGAAGDLQAGGADDPGGRRVHPGRLSRG